MFSSYRGSVDFHTAIFRGKLCSSKGIVCSQHIARDPYGSCRPLFFQWSEGTTILQWSLDSLQSKTADTAFTLLRNLSRQTSFLFIFHSMLWKKKSITYQPKRARTWKMVMRNEHLGVFWHNSYQFHLTFGWFFTMKSRPRSLLWPASCGFELILDSLCCLLLV